MRPLKRTKIVATISDKRYDNKFLTDLYNAGLDVVRLNTAHLTPGSCKSIIDAVREVSDTIAILIDTKGPEIRTTVVDKEIAILENEEYFFSGDPQGTTDDKDIYVTYINFANDLSIGDKILIDDGALEFEITGKADQKLICKALNSGPLSSRKSINVPGAKFKLASLSERDKEFVQFAIDEDIEFIAHSFVRHKQDALDIQNLLDAKKSNVKIIAKIENQEGVDNLDEILDYVYGVMVARGDLGIEIPAERIPGIQQKMLDTCIERRKPVIIATQMLHTMIDNPRPTRAEVTDVANAISQGTDAIMLSGETAYGKYPVEAVSTMSTIALEVESTTPEIRKTEIRVLTNEISAFLTRQAVKASTKLDIKAIIADSGSGRTIRNLAAYRGKRPIFAICYKRRTMRELSLSHGVYGQYFELSQGMQKEEEITHANFLHKSLNYLTTTSLLQDEDTVVVIAGNFGQAHGASFIEISTVNNLTQK